MNDQPTEIPGTDDEQLPGLPDSAYPPDAQPIEELVGNPADPEAAAAQPPPTLDPFTIAGQALAAAVDTFNVLGTVDATAANHATRKAAAEAFDRASTLAAAASTFAHALVAREQLQLMAGQIAAAQEAKREVILTPGSLPNLRRV